jgi:hypothetical protein
MDRVDNCRTWHHAGHDLQDRARYIQTREQPHENWHGRGNREHDKQEIIDCGFT